MFPGAEGATDNSRWEARRSRAHPPVKDRPPSSEPPRQGRRRVLSLVGSAAPPGRMFLSSLPIRWARSASPRFPPAIVRCASGAGDPRSVGVTTSGAGDPRSVGSHDYPRLLRRDHRSGWVSRSPVCYDLVQLPARECPLTPFSAAVWADTHFREAVLSDADFFP